jgi:NAD+ synthase
MDIKSAVQAIGNFLTESLETSGCNGYVVGVSGGIDSAVSTALAVRAVGAENVLGVSLPYRASSESSRTDAGDLAAQFKFEFLTVDISPMIDAYFPDIEKTDRLRAGNKMARERMSILFDLAQERSRLVLGTGNRTEICLGYTTWYGDAACSVNPIGELYKCDIRQLAQELGVPESIISKPPSADLWADQTDEAEIGLSYDRMDGLLELLVERSIRSRTGLTAEGFTEVEIDRVISMLNRNYFKRQMPEVAALGRGVIPRSLKLTD